MKSRCLASFFFLLLILGVLSAAEVRVAYCSLGDYYTVREDGFVDSYDSAYLETLAKKRNIDLKYIYAKNWNEELDLLRRHEVDLVGAMQYTDAQADEFAFCPAPYGVTYVALACLPTAAFNLGELSDFEDARVGMVQDYINADIVRNKFMDEGVSPEYIYYSNYVLLHEALENGEIDMVAENSHVMKRNWKILAKWQYSSLYFVT